jgi:hypothetical protein
MVISHRIEKIRSEIPKSVMLGYGRRSTTIMRGVEKSSKLL